MSPDIPRRGVLDHHFGCCKHQVSLHHLHFPHSSQSLSTQWNRHLQFLSAHFRCTLFNVLHGPARPRCQKVVDWQEIQSLVKAMLTTTCPGLQTWCCSAFHRIGTTFWFCRPGNDDNTNTTFLCLSSAIDSVPSLCFINVVSPILQFQADHLPRTGSLFQQYFRFCLPWFVQHIVGESYSCRSCHLFLCWSSFHSWRFWIYRVNCATSKAKKTCTHRSFLM